MVDHFVFLPLCDFHPVLLYLVVWFVVVAVSSLIGLKCLRALHSYSHTLYSQTIVQTSTQNQHSINIQSTFNQHKINWLPISFLMTCDVIIRGHLCSSAKALQSHAAHEGVDGTHLLRCCVVAQHAEFACSCSRRWWLWWCWWLWRFTPCCRSTIFGRWSSQSSTRSKTLPSKTHDEAKPCRDKRG